MRAQTPRRTRREIASALKIDINQLDYWIARERKVKREPSLRRSAPKRRPRPRFTKKLERRMIAFKNGDRSRRCRNPDCERPFVLTHAHHSVYKQHVIAEGKDEWDPWLALNICPACHGRHHDPFDPWKLPMRSLRANNISFAEDLFGPYKAYVYFHRRYDGEDPRVERLLERAEAA